jgi:hypothetical protein
MLLVPISGSGSVEAGREWLGFHQHLISLHDFLNYKKCHLSGICTARQREGGDLVALAQSIAGNRPTSACENIGTCVIDRRTLRLLFFPHHINMGYPK